MRKILFLFFLMGLSLIPALAQDIDSFQNEANKLIEQNRPEDAVILFEKIIATDTRNYESYAFLGNYRFLLGKQAIDKADSGYQKILLPNSMQIAHYDEELRAVYYNYYEKANSYILKALEIQKNDHLNNLIRLIQAFKEKVGLVPAKTEKGWFRHKSPA